MSKFNDILKSEYRESIDTLKNASCDTENNVYMCQSQLEIINFDTLTRTIYPDKHPSSYDALWSDEEFKNIYCVEFKNQDKSGVKNKNIQKKARDGKFTLDEVCTRHNINLKEYTTIYCVVYKSNPNKREYQNRYEEAPLYFGLEKYEGVYFDKIRTNNIDFFINKFSKRYSCE